MRGEDDVPDLTDLYGKSRLLGERYGPSSLALRTSIIGPSSLYVPDGVVLTQPETIVRGYPRALSSGLTTNELATIILSLLATDLRLTGLGDDLPTDTAPGGSN